MKILVCIKRVVDYEAKLVIKSDGLDVERNNVNMIMNPFDEIALEAALRIKDKQDCEVVVLSIGYKDCEAQLRSGMAMGADRGILVEADLSLSQTFDSLYIAKIIAHVLDEEKPNLVLMGKQAIDDDNHQVSEMLAEICDWPQATQANSINLTTQNTAIVAREADGGLQTIEVSLPCIITSDLRLNEPRYASLPGIMKAKKKPLDIKTLASFNIQHDCGIKVTKLLAPKKRVAGVMLKDVAELVSKLKYEAKVI